MKNTTPIDSTGNRIVKYYYDEAGNVVTQKTSTGTAATNGIPTNYDTVNYTYDSMNRLTAVNYPIDATTTDYTAYTYDSAGNITQMAAGGRKVGATVTVAPKTTTYTYDRFGNVLTETNGLNAAKSYTYDINGAMLTSLDRNNILTQYAYDNRGRLISKIVDPGEDAIAYTYNYALNGALLQETRNDDYINYYYDSLGRQNCKYDGTYSIYCSYNIGDLRQSGHLYAPEGDVIGNSYLYDAAGRLTSVTGNDLTTTYSYITNNSLSSVTYHNSAVQNYIYNAGGDDTKPSPPTRPHKTKKERAGNYPCPFLTSSASWPVSPPPGPSCTR